ncbi:MAG: 4Fe-4S binding protein, partial [Spirochaetales bacterium]|nr:4Fe-4S binding protein [Spirochaetales bacterium]
FAIDAIALGKQAAVSLHRYVHGDNLTFNRERDYRAFDRSNLDMEGYDRIPREKTVHVDGSRSKETFTDLRETFTEEQILNETKRCLGCGAAQVDQYQCVGCGICTTKCKFDAITLSRKYDTGGAAFDKMKPIVIGHVIKRHGKIVAKSVKRTIASPFGGR